MFHLNSLGIVTGVCENRKIFEIVWIVSQLSGMYTKERLSWDMHNGSLYSNKRKSSRILHSFLAAGLHLARFGATYPNQVDQEQSESVGRKLTTFWVKVSNIEETP